MLMNNCFQVLHIARPNFYVKLELPPGRCYNISCQGGNAIQNQDATIKVQPQRVGYRAPVCGKYSEQPTHDRFCFLFFSIIETYSG